MPLPAHTIALTGIDAIAFAQAQFSADIGAIQPGRWQWSAWLTAKGRVRALMHVARIAENELLLLLRGGSAEAMATELRRFVFRSKVALHVLPVRTLTDVPPLEHGAVVVDAHGTTFGFGNHAFVVGDAEGSQAWRTHAIDEGYPWLDDKNLEQLLPPSLSLERLHGVSFSKGCFPGQEIVARLHHLGGNKHHLHTVRANAPLTDGLTLSIDGKHAGVVLNSMEASDGGIALTVIADEVSKRSNDAPMTFNDGTVVLMLEHAWGP